MLAFARWPVLGLRKHYSAPHAIRYPAFGSGLSGILLSRFFLRSMTLLFPLTFQSFAS
jgi:hypothetical protein